MMWCRRPSRSTVTAVAVIAALTVLLVVVYNGQTNGGHTPITHNTLLNIHQKVSKYKLRTKGRFSSDTGKTEMPHQADNISNESYQVSSSDISVDDGDRNQPVSALTGDNAREVRVSSSTTNNHAGSTDDDYDDDEEDDLWDEAVVDDDGDEDKKWERTTGGKRTMQQVSFNMKDRTEGRKYMYGSRKRDWLHIWDEYNPSTWENLPLLSTSQEAEMQPGDAVIYNRVGKCGSRSVINILRELAMKNQFNFVSSLVYNKTRISPDHEAKMVGLLSRLQRPYIFQRHLHFVDFRRYGVQKPKYINIIRDPLARMVSQYYFSRFGDGKSERVYKGKDKYQTFDECVLRKKEECMGKKSFYIIPFFCGQDPRCKIPSSWSLKEAMTNLREHYIATGLLEELEDTFRVFEKVLPNMFGGAMDVYSKIVSGELNTNLSIMFTKHKVKPSSAVAEIMREHMKLEYTFYNYVKIRFHSQKRELGLL